MIGLEEGRASMYLTSPLSIPSPNATVATTSKEHYEGVGPERKNETPHTTSMPPSPEPPMVHSLNVLSSVEPLARYRYS